MLVQTLLAAGIVDTLRLLTFPVLLGKGKRLFAGNALPGAFKVVKSVVTPTGVVAATYEREGAVKTGSFV
jgi:dihydrofolate reductase